MADGTLTARSGALGGTSMRYHELAIQRWLNSLFYVREGYPTPVVFTSPMDAFSHFGQLWSEERNPFRYLLDLKDEAGKPLYQPHPAPARYPIISVHRKGWKYRTYQNFSIHRWRHINWPTVSDAGPVIPGKEQQGTGLTKCELGEVTTARRPMAWDYRFQIDHFCNRPDSQAFFIEQFMQTMWRTGGVPQTWIQVDYPGYGKMLIRLYLDGDIESMTPEEPQEGQNVEFRTSFTIVAEGWDVDLRYKIYPAMWYLIVGQGEVDPLTLENAFVPIATLDSRIQNKNTTLDSRPNIPPEGKCAEPPHTPFVSTIDFGAGLRNRNGFGADFVVSFRAVSSMVGFANTNTFGPYAVTQIVTFGANGSNANQNAFGPFVINGSSSFVSVDASNVDVLTDTTSFGNIPIYDLFNFVNNGSFSQSAFGTYFFAVVPSGTFADASGSLSYSAFGTHTPVSVIVDCGTDSGPLVYTPIGTYTEVVTTVLAGTEAAQLGFDAFGTAAFVVQSAGTFLDNFGTMSFTVFGTYVAI